MAQSQAMGRLILQLNPRVDLKLVPIESDGDRVRDHPLARFGGKGLFTRNIEVAISDGHASNDHPDIAIHSFKDLPTQETPGLIIAATPPRAAVEDVLIARDAETIEDLPEGAVVGTCSPRRKSQLLRLRPDFKVVHLRGNVQTRMNKVLVEKSLDATLLAAAGLHRVGLAEHARKVIPVEQVLPACGQGALAVQCRGDDHITMRRCLPLNCAESGQAVAAERTVAAALKADCHSPVAIYAECLEGNQLRLRARVLSTDGTQCAEAEATGPSSKSKDLCKQVSQSLLDQGARELLDAAARESE